MANRSRLVRATDDNLDELFKGVMIECYDWDVKVARDAIPDGGGVAAGIDFLLNPERIRETTRAAFEFVQEAIDAVRAAPDNPYGDDEEAIAKHIVEEIEKRWEQKKRRENR